MPPFELMSADALLTRLDRVLCGGERAALVPVGEDDTAVRRLLADAGSIDDDAALVVTTSGSTGAPKGIVLGRAGLLAGARATHARLGGPGTWHCPLPLHYVAGAMTAVRAVVGGTGLRRVRSDLTDLDPGPGRNYVSVVPTQLHRALDDSRVLAALAACDAVLLGGAPARPELVAVARAAGLTVVRTYGMSETGGGCVYEGVPLDGVAVDIGADGRITLVTPTAFLGYVGPPDLTASVLDRSGQVPRVTTQDRGRIGPDGRLQVLGRVDDVVITGGVNVDLAAVQRVVEQAYPGVAVALVGVPDAEWGTAVALGIEAPVALADVRARLRATLEPAALPRIVVAGALPRLESGKVDRRGLARRAAELARRAEEGLHGDR